MTPERIQARLENRKNALRDQIRAARRALDVMEAELARNPDEPIITGGRSTFIDLIHRAAEVETLGMLMVES